MIPRPLDISELPSILALQHRLEPPERAWTLERVKAELFDLAREGGATVRVVGERDRLRGIAALVIVGQEQGLFFVSPFWAEDRATADVLLATMKAEVLSRGSGQLRITVPIRQEPDPKAQALAAAGFAPVFDFLDLHLDIPASLPPAAFPAELRRLPLAAIQPRTFADLHNICFKDEENAPPIQARHAVEMCNDPTLWADASGVWVDSLDQYLSFVLCNHHGEIMAVGVHPKARQQGLARAMITRVAELALKAGLSSLHSVVASTNPASISLHRALFFYEIGRRRTWEINLHLTFSTTDQL